MKHTDRLNAEPESIKLNYSVNGFGATRSPGPEPEPEPGPPIHQHMWSDTLRRARMCDSRP